MCFDNSKRSKIQGNRLLTLDDYRAAIQIGSLLVLKNTDDNGTNLVAMELTNEKISYLSRNAKILNKLKDLVLRLTGCDLPVDPINYVGVLNTSIITLQPTQNARLSLA